MHIETKEVEYCKLQVQYVADPDVVQQKRKEVLNQIRKQIKHIQMPGFRPGKATDDVIKLKFKKEIQTTLMRELIAHAYDDILFETKIRPIGYPKTENSHLDGSAFSC